MRRREGRVGIFLLVMFAVILAGISVAVVPKRVLTITQVSWDWREDWEVQSGFDISVDSEGFDLPSSIAFVLNPGTSPKDPIYFVTELRGRVKVITNDRSVFTFAEISYDLQPTAELPAIAGEVGMAGVCLDPKHGYVFVTFAYRGPENILRNNIIRFDTKSDTFSVAPVTRVDFTDVFLPYRSVVSHQIGSCQIRDDLLYVSVADGSQVQKSQQLGSLLGKFLRMTLDGKPVSTNPFYQDENIAKARNYVWAMGLRNPFGLKLVGDRMFVADNGIGIDRFLQIRKGTNYLWDGTEASMALNADAVLLPSAGVGQLDYYSGTSGLFPSRLGNSFFVAITGNRRIRRGIPNIAVVPYDLRRGELPRKPSTLLRYNGDQVQIVAGLGLGPDGLYFAPMLPNKLGGTAILKVKYDPAAEYPFVIGETRSPIELMRIYDCLACHSLDDNGEGNTAPVLDRAVLVPRVMARLNSDEHVQAVKKVDQLTLEPFVSFREARRRVEQARGLEQVRLWLEYRIQEPRFDDADAQMPSLGIDKEAAAIIAAYLAPEEVKQDGFFGKMAKNVKNLLPRPTQANTITYGLVLIGLGFVSGGIFALFGYWLLIRLRERNSGRRT